MFVSERGLEANFFSEYRESIIAHGRFVRLFLRGVAPAGHCKGRHDGGGVWRSGRVTIPRTVIGAILFAFLGA